MIELKLTDGWEERLDAVVVHTGHQDLEADWVACKFELKRLRTSLATAERERERLELENTILRGMTAKHMPCRYCGVDEIAKCPQGFPGCGLADDILCAQDEQMRHMLAELAELRREVERLSKVFNAAVDYVDRASGPNIDSFPEFQHLQTMVRRFQKELQPTTPHEVNHEPEH